MDYLSYIENALQTKVLYYYETKDEFLCITEPPTLLVKLIMATGGVAYPKPVVKILNKSTLEITERRVEIYDFSTVGCDLHIEIAEEDLSKFKPVKKSKPFRNYYSELKAIVKVLSLF